MPQCAQDSSFGPASTCRRFDFTLYFEQAFVFPPLSVLLLRLPCRILSFAPDSIFAVLAAFRLWFLRYRSNKLQSPGWPLLSTKLLFSLFLVGINAAIVKYLLEVRKRETIFVWLPAPAMQLASTASSLLFRRSQPTISCFLPDPARDACRYGAFPVACT
jgi:ATP-binding cassette subfamily C (CFTR/MRP) protein 1